jgi:hypothetical protein
VPQDAVGDQRDLGVIENAGRLGMTADEAERAYWELCETDGVGQPADWRHRLAAILEKLAAGTDAVSSALARASQGLERSHR